MYLYTQLCILVASMETTVIIYILYKINNKTNYYFNYNNNNFLICTSWMFIGKLYDNIMICFIG